MYRTVKILKYVSRALRNRVPQGTANFRKIGQHQHSSYGTIFDLYKFVKKAPSLI